MTEESRHEDLSVWSQTDWSAGATQFMAARGGRVIARSGWYPRAEDAWQALGRALGWIE